MLQCHNPGLAKGCARALLATGERHLEKGTWRKEKGTCLLYLSQKSHNNALCDSLQFDMMAGRPVRAFLHCAAYGSLGEGIGSAGRGMTAK